MVYSVYPAVLNQSKIKKNGEIYVWEEDIYYIENVLISSCSLKHSGK
jgi:hypothetical protein